MIELQLSHENKREGLLPDCRVVKQRTKTIQVECIGSTHDHDTSLTIV